jgi:phospholipid transport system transporter-binding protein
MAAPQLRELGGGRFEIAGDLVFETVPGLLAAGDAALGSRARAEIDLAGVGRIDSAGLALLLEWTLAARAAGRALGYRNAPAALAALSGLAEVETLLPSAGTG